MLFLSKKLIHITIVVFLFNLVCLYVGQGKTLAFLIPAIDRMLMQREQKPHGQTQHRQMIGLLVLSPTRELASQVLLINGSFNVE